MKITYTSDSRDIINNKYDKHVVDAKNDIVSVYHSNTEDTIIKMIEHLDAVQYKDVDITYTLKVELHQPKVLDIKIIDTKKRSIWRRYNSIQRLAHVKDYDDITCHLSFEVI